jgi:hypothetical protein
MEFSNFHYPITKLLDYQVLTFHACNDPVMVTTGRVRSNGTTNVIAEEGSHGTCCDQHRARRRRHRQAASKAAGSSVSINCRTSERGEGGPARTPDEGASRAHSVRAELRIHSRRWAERVLSSEGRPGGDVQRTRRGRSRGARARRGRAHRASRRSRHRGFFHTPKVRPTVSSNVSARRCRDCVPAGVVMTSSGRVIR